MCCMFDSFDVFFSSPSILFCSYVEKIIVGLEILLVMDFPKS